MLSCPHIIISEYNQTYHTSPSCYYILDLLCVTNFDDYTSIKLTPLIFFTNNKENVSFCKL